MEPVEGIPDTTGMATVTVDEHGIVTEWSTGARRLLGHPAEDVLGEPVASFLAEGGEDVADVTWRSALGLSRWAGSATLRHRSGDLVEAELIVHREMGKDGRPEWLLVCAAAQKPPSGESSSVMQSAFFDAPYPLAVCDTELRVVWSNAEMRRAIGMKETELHGLRPAEALPHPDVEEDERVMRRVLATGERQYVENFLRVWGESREHAWEIALSPVTDAGGRVSGVLFSARDTTEQYWSRQRLLLTNEASKRIGSTLDVDRIARELTEVAVPGLADYATVDLLPFLHHGDEPSPGPLTGSVTMRRTAEQSLPGDPTSSLSVGETVTYPESSPVAESLAAGWPRSYEVTDSLWARWALKDPALAAGLREYGTHSLIAVPMRARGITFGIALFSRHRREEPFGEDDLLLAEEITARAAVCTDNARQYARERSTSVTLQRSLLPQSLPDQTAVTAASRYLPAGTLAGVGGDWFDVIQLSGARVALVVGDVVGHGIPASVTMGRLRTAVRTLADIDLPPDELLTHLDDLVSALDAEADLAADEQPRGNIGATCLYAVYDPVARRCSVASAGHPPPITVRPDGTAEILDLRTGPPLGLGGLPFEVTEVDLPEGTLLALYTDGLIETRGGDLDERLDTLRSVLARPAQSLEAACDTVLEALLTPSVDDDVALLLARTRGLGAEAVATWDIPSDPAAVNQARQNTLDKLTFWGLDDAAFTTELVISELVTNAIRHGQPPVQLRLIYDRHLICEVSDGSSSAPHLRRSPALDEGGRGLFLVAQLTQRWGSRRGRRGKTIWAEQHLPSVTGNGPY